ncbi:Cytochrome P450-DIT2 [Colletotrichum spinosum]|uniref:Cytochrome P450-DIT2 n=1 Tax=Colletotrichum spinosum TaxID=1347390 RepID=A0A4R8PVE3_9PEZI|nr:Cytochrome P450-DIT2 [Colletotrichum spinosum]
MLFLLAELLLLGTLLSGLAYYFFLLPPRYPQNIPAIPFWVALIPFFKDVDQSDIFRAYIDRPLRTHGAVKLFFGAQWNILVHRPSYLADMFKNEDLYQKSGNQKKIPHSVLADFLGDNIISAHGDTWKKYQSVVKPGLQRSFEASTIAKNAVSLCRLLRDAQKRAGRGGVAVQDLLQRYSVANCSEAILETNLGALDSADAPINLLQTAVKREIFKPVFLNFPVLDHPALRRLFPSRARARDVVARFKNELKRSLILAHRTHTHTHTQTQTQTQTEKPLSEGLGGRMVRALDSGLWTEKQFLDNLTVTFVAGQENPQLLMTSALYLLAKHPETQETLLREIIAKDASPTSDFGQVDMPFLTSVIYECLRLFPPIGQLINRRAAAPCLLGGDLVIPEGTYLGYHCRSTNCDPVAWGPGCEQFDPGRWGLASDEIRDAFRRRRARGEFVSFHGGRRACLGERFAMLEMRATLVGLVREFRWALDPTWVERMTPAGPLYPRALRVVFEDRLTGEKVALAE